MPPEIALAESSVHRLEGVFDGLAARSLQALLERASPHVGVLIDLTQVREFHDFGVAVLGEAIAHTQARVTLRGLRRHHISVLRYFGIETEPVEQASALDDA
jgi:anti-anti-sigma regulatory factor